jgi:hypothetical protein
MSSKTTPDFNLMRTLLHHARCHFKLAFGLTASHVTVTYLDVFTFRKHRTEPGELTLTPAEEKRAFAALEHCATYLCVVQVHTVLQKLLGEKEQPTDDAFQIARLIRNSFAHNPFYPQWQLSQAWQNRVLSVLNVIQLDTSNLDGKPVKREHYGGPIAILRFIDCADTVVEKRARQCSSQGTQGLP